MGLRTESMISYPLEKLKGIGGESWILMNNTQAKLKEMGGESWMNNTQAKLKEMGGESWILMNNTQAKLKEMGADEVMNNLQEKLKELWLMLQNFGLVFISWLDEVFPPETRKEKLQHWLRVSAPFIVTGLVLLVLFWFCRCCIGWCCWCFSICIRCCSCSIKGVKMMIAPGRNFRIPRVAFEANPKLYFRALHAGKPFKY